MSPTATQKLLGRVQRVIPKDTAGYGFIVTDDHRKCFFHQTNCVAKKLPRQNDLVEFDLLPQTVKGKSDRAINVKIVSAAA